VIGLLKHVLLWLDAALAPVAAWLNPAADALGGWLLAPLGVLPGWLSATLVAAVTGVLMLLAFKYTSNQRAIKRVRDGINADLLTLKLFKESAAVAVRAQGRLLRGAALLLVLALVPTAVMFVPAVLALGQLSLWYQQRPLKVGEEALVTLKLNGDADAAFPDVSLRPPEKDASEKKDPVEATAGPVRIRSQREVCWTVKANKAGYHRLVFDVGGQTVEKELAIGDSYMRVSAVRPGWSALDVAANPCEPPFRRGDAVESITIDYPPRESYVSGTTWWMAYWFAVSLITGFCFRGVLGVNM
jgi:hypothetical protein